MAAWALGQTDDGGTAELANAARGDRSDDVREVAVWALGERGARDPAVLSALTAALHDRDEAVRGTAAWGLGQFHLEAAPKALLAALTDSSRDVRLKAAWALSEIGDSTALPMLRAALRHETSTEVERAQLRALMRSGEVPEQMVEWLRSKDAGVREMAARALAGGEATQPWPWPWPRPRPQP
jgi:HEAT repeat protein